MCIAIYVSDEKLLTVNDLTSHKSKMLVIKEVISHKKKLYRSAYSESRVKIYHY